MSVRHAALLGVAAVAVVTTLAPRALGGTVGGCGLAAARVVFRREGAVVVREPSGAYGSDGPTYACRAARPTVRTRIDQGNLVTQDPTDQVKLGPFAARGATLAVGLGYGDGSAYLEVVDLATRAQIAKVPAVPDSDAYLGDPAVVTVALGAPGQFAWAVAGSLEPGLKSTAYQVLVRDANGVQILDSSAKIAARSLRLAGGTVSWTDGGTAMTAPA
jgi:hypothetical protein